VLPFEQTHGDMVSLGFRVGRFAYSCDLSGIPQRSELAVSGLGIWIVDALRPTPHPSHLSLPETLELVARMRPERAVLTNLHIDMDYDTVERMTPDNVTPAYDGLKIDVTAGAILSPEKVLQARGSQKL
jgi:phosphoribosyl 1,2-cyclic phosphate phosphodiesterase